MSMHPLWSVGVYYRASLNRWGSEELHTLDCAHNIRHSVHLKYLFAPFIEKILVSKRIFSIAGADQ